MDNQRDHYRKKIRNMSNAGIADSTIAKIIGISIIPTRRIILDKEYIPTPRTQEIVARNYINFLLSLDI